MAYTSPNVYQGNCDSRSVDGDVSVESTDQLSRSRATGRPDSQYLRLTRANRKRLKARDCLKIVYYMLFVCTSLHINTVVVGSPSS